MNWLKMTHVQDWRFHLSRLVPVRMRSSYGASDGKSSWDETASWWQWRGRVFRCHVERLA